MAIKKTKPEPEPAPEPPVDTPDPEPALPVAEAVPAVVPEVVAEKVAYYRPQKPTGPDPDGSKFRKWMQEDMAWKQHPDRVL